MDFDDALVEFGLSSHEDWGVVPNADGAPVFRAKAVTLRGIEIIVSIPYEEAMKYPSGARKCRMDRLREAVEATLIGSYGERL